MDRVGIVMETMEYLPCSTQPAPGIVIFTRSMQVKWASQRARDLIARTGGAYGWMSAENLPLEVVDLAATMLEELEALIPTQGWAHVEARRNVRSANGRFQLRGFGFPGPDDDFTSFHLVVVITESDPTNDSPVGESALAEQPAVVGTSTTQRRVTRVTHT